MAEADRDKVRVGLSRAELRRRFPGRPRVSGEHCGIWAWRGPGVFEGKIGGRKLDGIHRHKAASFPEAAFAELEAAGFEFVQWAAA